MKPDYKRFTVNRELFPRQVQKDSDGQICGHLNRLKYPTDVNVYLKNRQQGKSWTSSLAIANRCHCKRQHLHKDPIKEELRRIQIDYEETKNLIEILEKIQIVLPKQKKKQKK